MGRPSLCPLKRQMGWRHERNTTFLSRFAKQNLKNLFKSRPALIFATDVCLGRKSSHLEMVQIKHCEPKGRVRSPPQQARAGLWMWGARAGSPNTEAQLLRKCPSRGPWDCLTSPGSKQRQVLSQRECNNHLRSFGSETKSSSPRAASADAQTAPALPQSTGL